MDFESDLGVAVVSEETDRDYRLDADLGEVIETNPEFLAQLREQTERARRNDFFKGMGYEDAIRTGVLYVDMIISDLAIHLSFVTEEEAKRRKGLEALLAEEKRKIKAEYPQPDPKDEAEWDKYVKWSRAQDKERILPLIHEKYKNKGINIHIRSSPGKFKKAEHYKIEEIPAEARFMEYSSRLSNGELCIEKPRFERSELDRMWQNPMTLQAYLQEILSKNYSQEESSQTMEPAEVS